ncbi:MAG: S41 family peptidase [Thermoguttaceae bacterium]|jgi:carboxyl-terminal processing protease
MPRRNLLFLLAVCIFTLVCYQKTQTNQYGELLSESLDLIERISLEKVKPEELFEGAMEGMVDRLNSGGLDENSSYIPPKTLPEFREMIDQQFGGVGIEVAIDSKTREITVVSPLPGSPAFTAGVLAGDKILRIDDHSTQGMSIRDAASLLRGKTGDPVNITVLHQGEDKPVEIKIVRAVIQGETVLGDTRNADGSWNYFLPGYDRIGYLRITSFGDETAAELKRAVQRLVDHDMQGLILDLRDNPGGLLPAAIGVCDLFIPSGIIVSTRGRDGGNLDAWQASGKGAFTKFPMVVLVNQYSASASEIVAACLQDQHRAAIVGQRTYGKGTVQKVIELDDSRGALKLTTASYWRPSNKNIHRRKDAGENEDWGVSPDSGWEVRVEGDDLTRLRLWRMRRDISKAAETAVKAKGADKFVDRQLAKAVECLQKEMGKERVKDEG